MEQRDYFISFNSADHACAEALDLALRSAGFTTFYFPRDLRPGGNVAIWIDEALMNSTQILALYSPDYAKEGAIYSKIERYAALWQDASGAQNKLVPILLRDTALTPLIAPISHIDVRGLAPHEAAQRIIDLLRSPANEMSRTQSGPLPKVFHIPYRPNPHFSGRADELEALESVLQTNTITAIIGLGGVGKTALVTEFCHELSGHFSGVWWVRAENNSAMLADIGALGLRLKCVTGTSLEADARAALDHLASVSEPWLLVYDNAADADSIRDWLPMGEVRCIITSRFPLFDDVARIIQLHEWPNDVTTQYLLSSTNRSDSAGAQYLAQYLAGLPLAVEQAAAYLRLRPGTTFGQYVQDIANVIKVPKPPGAMGDYPDTVHAVFVKSLETLSSLEGGILASSYLCLFAFLSPDGIPLALLASPEAEEILHLPFGELAGQTHRDDALATTALLSLARFGDGPLGPTVVYHRLVLAVARDWMGPQNRVASGAMAAHLVNVCLPQHVGSDPSSWEFCAYLMSHVQALYEYAPQSGAAILPLLYVFSKTAHFFLSQGRPRRAIPFAKKCVVMARALPGDNQRTIGGALNLLGGVLEALYQFEDAQRAYENAIQVIESIAANQRSSNDDVGLANCISNLAQVLVHGKNYQEAQSLFSRASALMESAGSGPQDENSRLASLGVFYASWAQAEGKPEHFQLAEDFTRRALLSSQMVYGERHPHTALDYKNFAVVAHMQHNTEAAIDACSRATAITLSLGLLGSYLMSDFISHLIRFLTDAGINRRAELLRAADFTEFVLPIAECETKQRSWVAEDPGQRHFGPTSFFAPRNDQPDLWPRALVGFDIDLSQILADYDAQKLSSDAFARLLAEAIVEKSRQ